MSNTMCPECGYPLNGNESMCPECGYRFQNVADNNTGGGMTPLATQINGPIENDVRQTDWANYIYECWVIGWKAFTRMFRYSGRSSRREFWSYFFLPGIVLNIIPFIGTIIWTLGLLAVSIRRMHDINKSGWNTLIPFWCFFWYLKRSDNGTNYYGEPEPARSLLE